MIYLILGATAFVFVVMVGAIWLLRGSDGYDDGLVSDAQLEWLRRQRMNRQGGV